MDDSAVVCGYCGAQLSGTSKNFDGYKDPAQKEKIMNLIKKIVPGVAALIALIIAISVISSFTGYKGAVRKFMNAYKSDDVDSLVKRTCSEIVDEDEDSLEELFQNVIDSDKERYEDELGSKYKIKYEITNTKKYSDSKTKKEMEKILTDKDDAKNYKKMVEVKIKVVAKHKSEEEKTRFIVYFAKGSDGWKIADFNRTY